MSKSIEHKIKNVMPLDDHQLWLEFSNGRKVVADMSPILAKGGVFEPLRESKTFRKVKLEHGGRAIVWPGGVDLCADALYGPDMPIQSEPLKGATSFGLSVYFPYEVEPEISVK